MQDIELLNEWIQDLAHEVRREIEGLTNDDLTWQPDPQANSIGITVWHMSRWLDLIAARALQNKPPEEEQWHARGWRSKTGYDPRGLGSQGFGAVTGYTWEEVQAIPVLSAGELLEYFDQVSKALCEQLAIMTSESLHQPALGLNGKRSAYGWVKPILKGCLGHVGEIQALKAMKARTTTKG